MEELVVGDVGGPDRHHQVTEADQRTVLVPTLYNVYTPALTLLCNKLECFVPGMFFQPSLTNTLAEYENP